MVKLDPYTVESEKVDRPLEETLSSIGYLPGEVLEGAAVLDLNDALRFLANVRDADWIDSGIVIRGINSEGVGGPAGSPMATLYLDGIPQTTQGTRRGALGVWDVASVEVLRGPQSTLLGRNALAGAIRVETRDPSFTPEAAVLAGVGNEGFREGAAMVSGPLGEKFAYRFTVEADHGEGGIGYPNYQGLPNLDRRAEADFAQVRGKVLYQPEGEAGRRALLTVSQAYHSPAYGDVDGASAGVDFFEDRVWGLQTSALFDEARATDVTLAGLRVEIPLERDWRLESITGYTRTVTDRSSVDLATRGEIDEDEYSQEVRASHAGERFETVLGLFGLTGDQTNTRAQQRPWEAFQRSEVSAAETTNYALFGETRWRFAEAWSVVAGLRYDREENAVRSLGQRMDAQGRVISSTASRTEAEFDAWLPKIGIIHDLPNGSHLSLTVQRAYRAGGAALNQLTGTHYSFDPENAWNYEAAWKGTGLDGRLFYAVNLFSMDWSDQQINVPQVPGDFTSDLILNAGASTVWGGEIEVRGRIGEALRLLASVGLARTEFDDFRFLQFGSELDLSGREFPQAPDFSAVLGSEYEIGRGFSLGADVKYTSPVLSRSILEGLPADTLPSYVVANAQLAWRHRHWSVTAYVNNLADEEYLLYRYDDPAFSLATVGRGRTFGLNVQWRY